jgi:hypothetical protein
VIVLIWFTLVFFGVIIWLALWRIYEVLLDIRDFR